MNSLFVIVLAVMAISMGWAQSVMVLQGGKTVQEAQAGNDQIPTRGGC